MDDAEASRASALSISFWRKKFSNVRSTTIAASWPVSSQVGATAVLSTSAASSNSSATASQRPSRSRTRSFILSHKGESATGAYLFYRWQVEVLFDPVNAPLKCFVLFSCDIGNSYKMLH